MTNIIEGCNLTWDTVFHSDTAKREGIDNSTTDKQLLENGTKFVELVICPIIAEYGELTTNGGKVKINSFFRSDKLNKIVGGSPTSAHSHCLAVDIEVMGLDNRRFAYWCKDSLKHYDQIILENHTIGGEPNDGWVHIGLRNDANRYKIFEMVWENKKRKYIPIRPL